MWMNKKKIQIKSKRQNGSVWLYFNDAEAESVRERFLISDELLDISFYSYISIYII